MQHQHCFESGTLEFGRIAGAFKTEIESTHQAIEIYCIDRPESINKIFDFFSFPPLRLVTAKLKFVAMEWQYGIFYGKRI